jgi:hypothetical protein
MSAHIDFELCFGMPVSSRTALKLSLVCAVLLFPLFWSTAYSQSSPRFEDYPATETFSGTPAMPKLKPEVEHSVGDVHRSVGEVVRDGVQKGWGVFRDGKEQTGPNFAGHLIVIQWGCGAPCMRMAIVNARTGEVYYPPITFTGAVDSFDLPLLTVGNAVSGNPEVESRSNSNLMIVKATPVQSLRHPSFTYYFRWNRDRWTLLRRDPLR